jgi:hypothetical protein
MKTIARLLLVLPILLLVAAPVGATGAIAGRLLDSATKLPVADGWIVLFAEREGGLAEAGYTSSEADGSWSFANVPAGNYTVWVEFEHGDYVAVWWDGTRSGSWDWHDTELFSVVDGQVVAGIDFELTVGGSLSGRVLRKLDGSPLANSWITAWDAETDISWSAETDAQGRYEIAGIPSVPVGVETCNAEVFGKNLVCQWWDHTQNPDTRTLVPIVSGQKAEGIDFDLLEGGKISARLLRKGAGTPIAGGQVIVEGTDGTWYWEPADTDDSGRATLGSLPPGHFRVWASGPNYVGTYLLGDDGTPRVLEMTEGQVRDDVVIELEPGGTAEGTVRDLAGRPIAGATVIGWHLDGGWADLDATSDATGSWKIDAIPAGTYLFQAYETDYLSRFYDGATFGENGTPVAVAVEQTTSGIDFRLPPGGKISGRIVDGATGQPVPWVYVAAFFSSDLEMPGTESVSGADGRFTIGSVIPGDRIYLFAWDWQGRYAGRWWDGSYDPALARPVSARVGETTLLGDFRLEAPGVLSAGPTALAFEGQTFQEEIAPATITLSNAGPGPVTFDAWSEVDWLSVDTDGETHRIDAGQTATLEVSVWPCSLAAGTYTAPIRIWEGTRDRMIDIPVTLRLAAAPPSLDLSPSDVWFSTEVGGSDPPAESIWLANLGDGSIAFEVVPDVPWIFVSPLSGNVVHAEDATRIDIGVAASLLAEGHHDGTLRIVTSAGERIVTVSVDSYPSPEGDPDAEVPPIIALLLPGGVPSAKLRTMATTTFELRNRGTGVLNWNGRFRSDWFDIEPRSGSVPAGGSMTVTLRVDPARLSNGMNSTWLDIDSTRSDASIAIQCQLGRVVDPNGHLEPSAAGRHLVVPVLAHAPGQYESLFVSDLWISHLPSGRSVDARLSFVPEGVDGTVRAMQSTLTFESGQTIPLLDVVKNWLGADRLKGSLVIESDAIQELQVFSKIYNLSATGTFGQEIPAVPAQDGTTRLEGKIHALGLENSTDFRSNLILTETTGWPVTARIALYGLDGNRLGETTASVLPFGTTQIVNVFGACGVTGPRSGVRAEVEVEEGDGRIVVLGSMLDNTTSDPTTLFGPQKSSQVATIVVPVVAHAAGEKGSQWVSDVHLANVDSVGRAVRITFRDRAGVEVGHRDLLLGAGKGELLRDIVLATFGASSGAGSLRIDSVPPGGIVVQSRTYNAGSGGGTFGQGIPGRPALSSIAAGGRGNLIGLESSPSFRTNIGITEVGGGNVRVGVALLDRSGRNVLGYREIDLAAGGNFQANFFRLMGLDRSPIYAAEAVVTVVRGEGRVQIYASTVDNATGDGTTILPPDRVVR